MKKLMYRAILLLLVACFQWSAFGQEQQVGVEASRLSGVPKDLIAGSTIELVYSPKGGPLEGKDQIVALVYMYNFYKWELDDVELQKDGDVWKGRFVVPSNCAFLAFKFQSTWSKFVDISDNNDDKGFMYMTVGLDGQPLPGGYLAWGVFRKPSVNLVGYGYFGPDYQEIDQEALYFWYQREVQAHLQNVSYFFSDMMNIVQKQAGDRYREAVNLIFATFSSQDDTPKTEDNYITMENIYRYVLKDTVRADSMLNLILEKYPNGWTIRRKAFDKVYMGNPNRYFDDMCQFLKDYPVTDLKQHPEWPSFIYYNGVRRLAPYFFYPDKDRNILIQMIPDYNFRTLAEIYRSTVFPFHMKKAVADSVNYDVAKALISEMEKKLTDKSYCIEDDYSPHQSDEWALSNLDQYRGSYADILYCLGKVDEALAQITLISESRRYVESAVNETHLKCLLAKGDLKDINALARNAFKSNAVTPIMMDILKQQYVKNNGKEDGFEAYIESLKPEDEKEAFKEELKKSLIKEAYEPFQMEAMDKSIVKSADWKDKIVVLDFWASWCFPCRSSFPGMQMAVDRYANDPDVKFYFVDTMENSDNYKATAAKIMKEGQYTFNVLFDNVNPETKAQNMVFSSMDKINNSMAIPRKMILKDGYVRYTVEGYGGSPSKLVDEIAYVIEMLKAEK